MRRWLGRVAQVFVLVFVLVFVAAPLVALAFAMAVVGRDGLWNDIQALGGN